MYKLPYTGAEIEERLAKLDNLNAENFVLSETTADLYGLSGVDANVDTALKRAIVDFSSYQAFCANVNTNSLDSAFGKNNEDLIVGLGLQLAMYAWFKGDNKITYPFTNLISCDTLSDIANNQLAKDEIFNNLNVFNLINGNAYAKSILDFNIYLYKDGVWNNALFGVRTIIKNGTATVVENPTNITIQTVGGNGNTNKAIFTFPNPFVDGAKYNNAKFTSLVIEGTNIEYMQPMIRTTIPTATLTWTDISTTSVKYGTNGTITLVPNDYNGKYLAIQSSTLQAYLETVVITKIYFKAV